MSPRLLNQHCVHVLRSADVARTSACAAAGFGQRLDDKMRLSRGVGSSQVRKQTSALWLTSMFGYWHNWAHHSSFVKYWTKSFLTPCSYCRQLRIVCKKTSCSSMLEPIQWAMLWTQKQRCSCAHTICYDQQSMSRDFLWIDHCIQERSEKIPCGTLFK